MTVVHDGVLAAYQSAGDVEENLIAIGLEEVFRKADHALRWRRPTSALAVHATALFWSPGSITRLPSTWLAAANLADSLAGFLT